MNYNKELLRIIISFLPLLAATQKILRNISYFTCGLFKRTNQYSDVKSNTTQVFRSNPLLESKVVNIAHFLSGATQQSDSLIDAYTVFLLKDFTCV